MKDLPPEITEAEKLITQPLKVRRGWVIRERRDGRWIDHPQVRWMDALAAVRRLRAETAVRLAIENRSLDDFDDMILWAGETAQERHTSWKSVAQQIIRYLPDGNK